MAREHSTGVGRRDFARLLALGGAMPFLTPGVAWPQTSALEPAPARPYERVPAERKRTVRDAAVRHESRHRSRGVCG